MSIKNVFSKSCKYPNCRNSATHSWSLVPICESHHEMIRIETLKYYAKKIGNEDREHYQKLTSR